MRGPRIALLLLLVLGLAFALGVGLGFRGGRRSVAGGRSFRAPDWVQRLARVLRPLSPKVDIEPRSFVVVASAPRVFPVARDNAPFRTVTFRLEEGSRLLVVYEPPSRREGDLNEDLELPLRSGERSGSRIVFKEGGKLRVLCLDVARPCRVAVE